MKKLLTVLSLAVCVTAGSVHAAPIGEHDYNQLFINTLKVHTQTGSVTENGEPIPVMAAPYINENGVTMMEFYTLAESMGAEVTEEDGVFTVIYEGVELIFTLNSAEALIAGQKIPMPAAIVRADNGTVMAPLRFVAEALGADVTYDGVTGEIAAVSAGGLDEGINFKLLLKYANKTKIGNSKEGWRFTKTDNFDMNQSQWNSSYQFLLDDVSVNLSVTENDDHTTIGQLYTSIQSIAQGRSQYQSKCVLYDKGQGMKNDVPYVYIKLRGLDFIEEYYGYLTDNYIYAFTVFREFQSFSAAKDDPDVTAFLELLEFDYTGGDEENTMDLAGATLSEQEKEIEEYVDGNYSWKITPSQGWTVNEYYGFHNKVNITRPISREEETSYPLLPSGESSLLCVTTLSNPGSQSLADWAESKKQELLDAVNGDLYTVSGSKDMNIGGYSAKTFTLKSHDENGDVYTAYYLSNGYYRYELMLTYERQEEKDPGFLTGVQAMIQSFTPGQINREEIGDALETDDVSVQLQTVKEHECDNFSIQIPYIWVARENLGGVIVSDDIYHYSVQVQVNQIELSYYDDNLQKKTYTPEEFINKTLASSLNTSMSSQLQYTLLKPVETVTVLGKQGYRAELMAKRSIYETMYFTYFYIPLENGKMLVISKTTQEKAKNTIYEKAADTMIESIRLKSE